MPKTLLTFLIVLLTTMSLQGQTVCKGTVVSEWDEPIPNASVLIKNNEDHILQFGFTNEQGVLIFK